MTLPGFYGTFHFNIDDKGRIQIPSQFRRLMPTSDPRMVVMTRGPDSCIYAFPPDAWDFYMDQMLDLEMDNEERLELMREVLSSAINCMIDSQWRVKLPEELAEYAGLDREVKIIGQIDRLEIWSPAVHRKYRESKPDIYKNISMQLFIGKMPRSKRYRRQTGSSLPEETE